MAGMTIHEAMALIGHVQTALVQHGFPIGAWGPCKDGVDGRWGADSRAGLAAFATAAGLAPADPPTDAILTALQLVPPVSAKTFTEAIQTWLAFRANEPDYSVKADVVLCEALGLCAGQPCPGAQPPMADAPPPPPPQGGEEDEGAPLWLKIGLIVGGVAVAGFLGYQVLDWNKKRKRKPGRAGGTAPTYSAWKGPEVQEQELGEAPGKKSDEAEEEGDDSDEGEGFG